MISKVIMIKKLPIIACLVCCFSINMYCGLNQDPNTDSNDVEMDHDDHHDNTKHVQENIADQETDVGSDEDDSDTEEDMSAQNQSDAQSADDAEENAHHATKHTHDKSGVVVGLGPDMMEYSKGDYIELGNDSNVMHKMHYKQIPHINIMSDIHSNAEHLNDVIHTIVLHSFDSIGLNPEDNVQIIDSITTYIFNHSKSAEFRAGLVKCQAMYVEQFANVFIPQLKGKYTISKNFDSNKNLMMPDSFEFGAYSSLSSSLLSLGHTESDVVLTKVIIDFKEFVQNVVSQALKYKYEFLKKQVLQAQLEVRYKEAQDCIALGDSVPAKINHLISVSIAKLNRDIDKSSVLLAGLKAEYPEICASIDQHYSNLKNEDLIVCAKKLTNMYIFDYADKYIEASSEYNKAQHEARKKILQSMSFDLGFNILSKNLVIPSNDPNADLMKKPRFVFTIEFTLGNPASWITAKRIVEHASLTYASAVDKESSEHKANMAVLSGQISSLYAEIATAETLMIFASQIDHEINRQKNDHSRIRDLAKTVIDSLSSISESTELSGKIANNAARINISTLIVSSFSKLLRK